jgi:hypothetical protein
MAERPIVTIHLPLDMSAVGKILQAISDDYPDAVVGEPAGHAMTVHANPDVSLRERRDIARARLARGYRSDDYHGEA